jgi:hypothetical protein
MNLDLVVLIYFRKKKQEADKESNLFLKELVNFGNNLKMEENKYLQQFQGELVWEEIASRMLKPIRGENLSDFVVALWTMKSDECESYSQLTW